MFIVDGMDLPVPCTIQRGFDVHPLRITTLSDSFAATIWLKL